MQKNKRGPSPCLRERGKAQDDDGSRKGVAAGAKANSKAPTEKHPLRGQARNPSPNCSGQEFARTLRVLRAGRWPVRKRIRALVVWDLRRRNGRFARVSLQALWCQFGRPLDGPQRPRRSTNRVFLLRAVPSASARSQGHRPSPRALALTDRSQRRCPASIRDSRSTLLGYTAHAVKRVPRFISASSVRSNVKLVVDRAMKRLGFLHLDVSGPLRWVERERPHPWDRVFLSRCCCIVFHEKVKGSLFGIAPPCDLSCIGSETYRNSCMSRLVCPNWRNF